MLYSIDLVHPCVSLPEQPVLLFVCLAQLGGLLDLLDEVAHIGHLLALLIVPLSQAEVLVHHNDVTGLLILEEKCVREEDFAAGEHLLFRVILRLGDQLVHQHVEAHVFFADVVVLFCDDFLLESLVIGYLGMADRAFLLLSFLVVTIAPLILICFALVVVLVLLLVPAASEERAALDIAELVALFPSVLAWVLILASRHASRHSVDRDPTVAGLEGSFRLPLRQGGGQPH